MGWVHVVGGVFLAHQQVEIVSLILPKIQIRMRTMIGVSSCWLVVWYLVPGGGTGTGTIPVSSSSRVVAASQ